MTISNQIKEQAKEAMRAKDSLRLNTLRGLLAAFTNELVAKMKKPNEEISDEDALTVIKRAAKQRKDSIEQFKKGGREDLATIEEQELNIVSKFLPQMMSKEEILQVAKKKKEETSVIDKSKIGIFIGELMKELRGKADGSDVKEVVETLFN